MTKKTKLILSIVLLGLFVVWTVLLKVVDVQAIGPQGTSVGFAALNKEMYKLTSYNELLFKITDYLMYSVIAGGAVFAVLGIIQWIKRKSLLKVDHQILLLGIGYLIVIAAYVLFDKLLIVNYRPCLAGAETPEPSYPSSHTMTALFVFITAIPMVEYLLEDKRKLVIALDIILIALAAFTVIGRFMSGAHWFTDIVGGALFAFGLFFLFEYFVAPVDEKKTPKCECCCGEGECHCHDETEAK